MIHIQIKNLIIEKIMIMFLQKSLTFEIHIPDSVHVKYMGMNTKPLHKPMSHSTIET